MQIEEFTSLKKRMTLIANNYFKAMDILKRFPSLSEQNIKLLNAYINGVNRAYELLEEEEKNFINDVYFYNGSIRKWKIAFTGDELEKKHRQVIIHFMEGFYATIR